VSNPNATVFIPGKAGGGNLTEPLSLSVCNFMSANWPNATALVQSSAIKFSTFWWDGYTSYQIHFLDRHVDRSPLVLGWQIDYAYDYVDAHVFVRKNTPVRPPELDDIKRSIETLVMTSRIAVPQINTPGSAYMRIVRTMDEPMASFVHDLWHSVVQIEIVYYVQSTD